MPTIQVFSYQRFSSIKQSDGDSIRRQTKRRDDWLARHNLVLDDRLTYKDAAKSAHQGRHATEGQLADFLATMDAGKVRPGDVLIIEALDRLTRQKPLEAVGLVSRILTSKIKVVTLDPEREYDWDSANNMGVLMELVVILCRGNEESERKSSFSRRNWDQLRLKARTGKPITPSCPGWLRLVDKNGEPVKGVGALRQTGGRWEKITEAVEVVNRIVRMALDGYGTEAITKRLNSEGVRTLKRGKAWDPMTVRSILRSQALIGAYQPMTRTTGRKLKVGEIIENFYPAVLSKKEYYRLQETLDNRMPPKGRTGANVRTLFKGLLHDLQGASLVLTNKGGRNKPMLVSSAAKIGLPGTKYCSFQYDRFEKYFLRFVKQLKPADLLPRQPEDTTETDISTTEGELAEVESRIAVTKKRVATDPNFTTLLDVLRDLDQRRKALVEQLDKLRQKEHQQTDKETLKETSSIADLLATAEDKTDLRIRLRAQIRRLVESIVCQPFTAKMEGVEWRCCTADVRFRAGGQRMLLIAYHRDEEQYETWASEEGIHVHEPDSLVARLGLLPKRATPRRR
jgi:DNA invertase Pin-like site-specific DNA recombinase